MPRHNLSDVTYIIPIYIDSAERLRNLQNNLRFLTSLFETTILIGEQKTPATAPASIGLSEFDGHFEYFDVPITRNNFYHTRLLNQLLAKVRTPLVCNLDCDAFFSTRQHLMATQMLRWNVAEFVLPQDGPVIHVAHECQDEVLHILQERPLNEAEIERLAEFTWNGVVVGGAIFGKTQVYRDSGGENENFLGWGWEDHERVERFQKLGHRVMRVPGNFHHFSHPRGSTSSEQHAHYDANWNEFVRIGQMPRAELEHEIQHWDWPR